MEGKGRTALVTGANSGMGKATGLALSTAGYDVILLVRSRERGEAALEELRRANPGASFRLELCDLGSLASVRAFAKRLSEAQASLEVLVNNAGVITTDRRLSQEGFELQFGVNHLGHFLLTSLLLPLLEAGRGRIVVVASGAHKVGKIHWDDLSLEKGYSAFTAYSQAKLANVLFARELAKRLEGKAVTVNACHPGAVATSMGVDRDTGFGGFITGLLKPFFLSPEEGADTAVWLATAPELEGRSGGYYYRRRLASISKAAASQEDAKRLWEVSERLTSA